MNSVTSMLQDGNTDSESSAIRSRAETANFRFKRRACLKRPPGRAGGRQLMSPRLHTLMYGCASTHAYMHIHHMHTAHYTPQTLHSTHTHTPHANTTDIHHGKYTNRKDILHTNTQEKTCKLIHKRTWRCRHDGTPHKLLQLK